LNLKVAHLEKKQLENEITNKQQTMKMEIRESELAAQIQENDLRDLERKLQLASIVATHSGVVTWVNKNIGAAIKEGEPLAHIGIPDSIADQLFTPFFSSKKDGQGIGLTLIKEILLNHGFEFSLKTISLGRTEFMIRF
jgi:hypothetical protein